jgi:hypothetical protein
MRTRDGDYDGCNMSAQCPAGVQAPDLATVQTEAQARLTTLKPKLPATFRFDWRGRAIAGRLESGSPHTVRLVADLGPVPYSAEDAARRAAVVALHGRRQFRTVNNRLTLTMSEPMGEPGDIPSVVTAIALALVKARPAIDAAEALIASPAATIYHR